MSAALEQAEELSRAAASTGSAARPLLLFYALSQAGRALTAVHTAESWEASSHGLQWPGPSASESILERRVSPERGRGGLFERVASAVWSEPLTAPVELGAVWSAIPELGVPALPGRKPNWYEPLYLYPTHDADEDARLRGSQLSFLVAGLRDLSGPDAVIEELKHYPSAYGGHPRHLQTDSGPKLITELVPALGSTAPRITWHATDASVDALNTKSIELAPPYQGLAQRPVIPRLPSGDWLRPLTLWWLLLFGLSNLARYEPDLWVRTLNVNEDPLAVPLESAMEEALDSIPYLVLEALLRQHITPGSYPTEGHSA